VNCVKEEKNPTEFNSDKIKKALAQLRSGQSLYGKEGATQGSPYFSHSNIVVKMMNKKMTLLIFKIFTLNLSS